MVDLIVKSKIKDAVPELNVAGEVPEALNKKEQKPTAEELCRRATFRAFGRIINRITG